MASLAKNKRFQRSLIPTTTLSHRIFSGTLLATATAIAITGGLPLLLAALGIGLTAVAVFTKTPIGVLLDNIAAALGGWQRIVGVMAGLMVVSLLSQGQPAHAIFDGARNAASKGIGKYIGTAEATSLIDTLLFAFWALAAVGGLAAIAGGVSQQIQVLVGGLILFFGMAVLIGILEFTDGILFTTTS